MKHPVYSYEKTRAMFERAVGVIPSGLYGHQGPAEGCHIPPSAFPQFSSRAKGSYFWDLDGNRFIDYMCAYGPNILGYGDPDVDEAAPILDLLAGRSLEAASKEPGGLAGLYFRGLPLGWLTRKGRRLLWSDR